MTSYKCSKCDFSRSVKGLVTQHITKAKDSNKEDHKGAKLIENIVEVQCEVCNKTYDNDEALKTHRKRCFEKKTLIEPAYVNPETVLKSMSIFTEVLRKYERQIIGHSNTIETLIKRIEKLEGSIKTENDNKRKGFRELDKEELESGNYVCSVLDRKLNTIENYENFLEIIHGKDSNYCPSKSLCSILGPDGNSISGEASTSCITASISGKPKKIKWGSVQFIIKDGYCNRDVKYQIIKTEECYCTKHFNLETGKPLLSN